MERLERQNSFEWKDKAYVDVTDNLTFLNDSFIWTSEKDGFNHIYLYDKNGKLRNQVTKGKWEVTYYGFDEKTNTVFYQSTENGSINRVYRIALNGKVRSLYLTRYKCTHANSL
jgi:dipeptidyl-peptidase-4